MDFIIVVGIGAILVATGVITPKPKDEVAKMVRRILRSSVCWTRCQGADLHPVNAPSTWDPSIFDRLLLTTPTVILRPQFLNRPRKTPTLGSGCPRPKPVFRINFPSEGVA